MSITNDECCFLRGNIGEHGDIAGQMLLETNLMVFWDVIKKYLRRKQSDPDQGFDALLLCEDGRAYKIADEETKYVDDIENALKSGRAEYLGRWDKDCDRGKEWDKLKNYIKQEGEEWRILEFVRDGFKLN